MNEVENLPEVNLTTSILPILSLPLKAVDEDENDNNTVIKFIQEDVDQCVADGQSSYKTLMDELLATNPPLKDTQLHQYHSKNLIILQKALEASYTEVLTNLDANPTVQNEIKELIRSAASRLETFATTNFNEVYLRKHEILADKTVRKVKELTNQAEMFFDEAVEELETSLSLKLKADQHLCSNSAKFNEIHKGTFQEFNKLLQENNLKAEEFWSYGLRHRLQERVQDLLDSNATTFDNESLVNIASKQRQINLGIGIYFDENSFTVGIYKPDLVRFAELSQESESESSAEIETQEGFKEAISVSPEICFSNKGVTIGQDANLNSGNSGAGDDTQENVKRFNIFQLITSTKIPMKTYELYFKHVGYNLCPHQIIAIFLRQVLEPIEKIESVASIGKIVFTTPSTMTSMGKGRLKKAALIAGFSDIRILSTMITSAIASSINRPFTSKSKVKDSKYSTKMTLPSPKKYLFVANLEKPSFSMGIVEITPTSISVISSYGSDNMVECQTEEFRELHGSLFENFDSSLVCHWKKFDQVNDIYKKAINCIWFHREPHSQPEPEPDNLLFSSLTRCIFGEEAVLKILKEKFPSLSYTNEAIPMIGHPLLGASIFASNSIWTSPEPDFLEKISAKVTAVANNRGQQQVFPQNLNIVEVRDSSRFDLRLSCERLTPRELLYEHPIRFMNSQFQPGLVIPFPFEFPLFSNDNERFTVKLEQILDDFGQGAESSNEACTYELTCKFGPTPAHVQAGTSYLNQIKSYYWPHKPFTLDIQCLMDADGILTLHPAYSSESFLELTMVRTDGSTCTDSDCEKQTIVIYKNY